MYAELALLAALAGLVGTLPQGYDSLAEANDASNTTTKYTHRTSFLTDYSTSLSASLHTEASSHISMDDSVIRARGNGRNRTPKSEKPAQHPSAPVSTPTSRNAHSKVHHPSRPVIHHTSRPGQNEPGQRTHHADSSPHNVGSTHKPARHGHNADPPVPTREATVTKDHKHPKRASPTNAFQVLSSALSSQRPHHSHEKEPVRSFRHSQQHHTPKTRVTGSKVTPIKSKHKVTGTKIHPAPSGGGGGGGGHHKSSKGGNGTPAFERKHPPSPITALPNHSSKVTGGQITPIVTVKSNIKPKSGHSKFPGINNPNMKPNAPPINSNKIPKPKPTPKNTGTGTVGHAKQVKTTPHSTKSQGNGGGFIGTN